MRTHLHVGFVVCTDSDCILQRLWGLELVLAVQSGASGSEDLGGGSAAISGVADPVAAQASVTAQSGTIVLLE